MAERIMPIDPEIRLAQILGEDAVLEATPIAPAPSGTQGVEFTGNPFEDFLAKAIDALEGVSKTEIYTNQMIEKYQRGEVELHEVMTAQSKMNIVIQLAVTTISTAVTTFKEITQMQV
ncbi:flagellar hook-basal body complex protein FliE [Candidatus Margulisiibacteriota bacterium]